MSKAVRPSSRPRTVAVWRTAWLPGSETFVRHHVDSLQEWEATALGFFRSQSPLARRTDEILLDAPPRTLQGRIAARTAGRRALLARLQADRPRILHAHFAHEAWPLLGPSKRFGIPLVVTLHGWDVTAGPRQRGLRGARHRLLLRRVFRRAARILAVSDYIAGEAIGLGADPGKVVVHYLGIPIASGGERTPPPAAKPCDVLFAGRLVEKKGVADLLAALGQSAPGARAVVVGDGPLRTELERDARDRGLDVEFTGMLDPDALRDRLRSAKLLAAPSRTAADGDAEGFGLVFLEAAAAGLPAVSYRHGGVPEAVQDGVTGLLAKEGDVPALGRAIRELLDDPDRIGTLGENARRRAREEFDIRRRSRELERLYDEIDAGAR